MTPSIPYRFPPLRQAGTAAHSVNVPAPGYPDGHAASLEHGRGQGLAQSIGQNIEQSRTEGLAQGWAEGMQRGADEGRALAREEFAMLARPVDALLENLAQLQAGLQAVQRAEVVDLVGRIARQVIRAELALQPLQLLALAEEALAALPRAPGGIEVFLNPEDLRRVNELDPVRAALWHLVPDPNLAPGECRVRAGEHEADAGCQGRLAAVLDQVRTQLVETQP